MRSKRLVEFRMAPKKSSTKGKEKEAASSSLSLEDGWLASKCIEYDILCLVDEHLLQPRSIVKWWPVLGHSRPFEETGETVTFIPFIECGFGIPTSDLFCSLLFHWGIQAHHLTPNSILHISIFVHLFEAFLGVKPHFDLFQHLLHLKPQPKDTKIDVIGGAVYNFVSVWSRSTCLTS